MTLSFSQNTALRASTASPEAILPFRVTLSSPTMLPLIQYAESLGLSRKRLMLLANIPEQILADPEQRMEITQADKLYPWFVLP